MKPSDVLRQRLREIRNAKGWSQRGLVKELKRIGVEMDPAAIARIEKGSRGVSLDEALQLAAVLEVSPIHLFLPKGKLSTKIEIAPEIRPTLARTREWVRALRSLPGQDEDFMTSMAAGDSFMTEHQPGTTERLTQIYEILIEHYSSGIISFDPVDTIPTKKVEK